MWNLSNIDITNLFTHRKTSYQFINELVVMLGENLDKKQTANSNGSGKSTLLEGITLAITGEVYRGVDKEDFITNDEQHCKVDLTMFNNVLNKEMRIVRTLFRGKKSSKLQIYFDKVLWKDQTSVQVGNKEIINQIGIKTEDILNFFLLGQGNASNFFTAKDTEQKQIISRFSNSNMIDSVLAELSKDIKIIEEEYQEVKSSIASIEAVVNSYDEQLAELKESVSEEDNKKTAESNKIKYRNKIKEIKLSIITYESKLRKLISDREKLKEHLDEEKMKDVQTECDALNVESDVLDVQTNKLKKEINRYEVLTGGAVKCPECNNEFLPESEYTLKQLKNFMALHKEVIIKNEERRSLLRIEIDKLEGLLTEFEEKKMDLKVANRKINNLKENIEEESMNLDNYENKLTKTIQELKDIDGSNPNQLLITQLQSKLKNKKLELAKKVEEFQMLESKRETASMLKFHMDKTGFKTYLANLSIKKIQDVTNFYLNKIGTNLETQINGYKINKDGTLRDKIEIFVVEDGVNSGLFNRYSGGEKARVSLSGIIGIRDLINNSCDYGKGLNFLAFDENILYLDNSGQIEAIKILEKLRMNCMVVMHQIDGIHIKNKVIFTKKNKSTTIKTYYENISI